MKETAVANTGDDRLRLVMVSNGYMSPECLEECNVFIDAYNIDLKSFSDRFYRKNCGGSLQPVLDTISYIANSNKWIEITTMIIPGENDSPEELDAIAQFIAGIDRNIPWHISRFFPHYRFTDHEITGDACLELARSIGKKHGLTFIYTGNTPKENSTRCPHCDYEIITRAGFTIKRSEISGNGACPACGTTIAGVWN